MIRIKAPKGKKIRDVKTERLYSEVVCKEKQRNRYVPADSEDNLIIEELDGVTFTD